MHGLINRALQTFLSQTYGDALWRQVADDARLGFAGFEAMLTYDPLLTDRVLDAACRALGRDREGLLEDMGTFLVTSPELPGMRRLLRFCGATFEEFLLSLDDLPDRVQLAVPDLRLPAITVEGTGRAVFRVTCHPGLAGFAPVVLGLLRAMADDYGVLALLEPCEDGVIEVRLIDRRFADGRDFRLGAGGA